MCFIFFQVLSTVQQTRIRQAISEKSSLLQNLRNGMLYLWHSRRKHRYEDFAVFQSWSKDRFKFLLEKIKYPVHIMVFGEMNRDGDVMPLVIFLHCLRLNTEAYIKCPGEILYARIERVAAGKPYVRPEDVLQCQTSRRTQAWLSEKILWSYLPIHLLGQDMTQGQFLSGVQQVWIQSCPSPRLVASPRLKDLVCPTIYP